MADILFNIDNLTEIIKKKRDECNVLYSEYTSRRDTKHSKYYEGKSDALNEVLDIIIEELLKQLNSDDIKPYDKEESRKHPELSGMDKG